jgi:hypothetical protein
MFLDTYQSDYCVTYYMPYIGNQILCIATIFECIE